MSASLYDALVIGGGPAGATAALLLAEAGWSVALVERKPFPRRKVCGEYLSATNWPLLKRLGIANVFDEQAGPAVVRTAVFAGRSSVKADLPKPAADVPWGRALSREVLDTLLVSRAAAAGAEVKQPWRCLEVTRDGPQFFARLECQESRRTMELSARVVIAAHGSWELGPLVTQSHPVPPRPSDLFGFKAHFRNATLPAGLMPLLSFVDGYGGMVHADRGLTSLSCCLRRSRLDRLGRSEGESAGEAVLQHILETCPVLRPVFDGAIREESWLSAGPIRPGFRRGFRDGLFVIGNAMGEAHPVVAEGISMAMQSAELLTRRLIAARGQLHDARAMQQLGDLYQADWRRSFGLRIRAAAAIAHWAMRPRAVAAMLPLLRRRPGLVTWGAELSGKSRLVSQGQACLS